METTKEFIFEREVNATVGLLFDVWTKVEHLEKWFGPAGFQIIVPKLELVPGGTFHYCMKALTGDKMWGKFVYQEIIPNEKLQFVTSFSNAEEGFTRHPMSETWPIEVLSTVYFKEENARCPSSIQGIWLPDYSNLIHHYSHSYLCCNALF